MALTRMDLPLLLGTAVTENRRKARAIGYVFHLIIGILFALRLRRLLPDHRPQLVVAGGAARRAARGLHRHRARQRAAADRASAHGDVGDRRERNRPDRAARIPDAQLRAEHVPRQPRGAHRLRRHRRLVVRLNAASCTLHPAPAPCTLHACTLHLKYHESRVSTSNHRLRRLSVVRIACRRARRQVLHLRPLESRAVGIRSGAPADRRRLRVRAARRRRVRHAVGDHAADVRRRHPQRQHHVGICRRARRSCSCSARAAPCRCSATGAGGPCSAPAGCTPVCCTSLMNMYWLWQMGPAITDLFGPARTVIIYTVGGVAGFALELVRRRLPAEHAVPADGRVHRRRLGAVVRPDWRALSLRPDEQQRGQAAGARSSWCRPSCSGC